MSNSFFNRQEKLIWKFSLSLILISLLGYFTYPMFVEMSQPTSASFIGYAYKSKGDIRIRQGNSINWVNIGEKDPVYSDTYIFTGKNSSAKFIFLDESTLRLGENSLIHLNFVIPESKIKKRKSDDPKAKEKDGKAQTANAKTAEAPTEKIKMEFIDGKLDIDLKENSNVDSIKINDTELSVQEGKTKIAISNKDENFTMSVIEGDVSMSNSGQGIKVKAGERVQITQGEEEKKEKIPEKAFEKLKDIAAKEEEKKKKEKLFEIPDFIKERSFKKFKQAVSKAIKDTKFFESTQPSEQ